MNYNKDEIKQNLSIEQIEDLVTELGGEPLNKGSYLVCKTICHNPIGEGSYKLYYYDNTKLFRCYTECEKDIFDIFELICKVKNNNNEIKYHYINGQRVEQVWNLADAMQYVIVFFQLDINVSENSSIVLPDWQIFSKYYKNKQKLQDQQKVELKIWDDKILNNLPKPSIIPWLKEGISHDVLQHANICYDPKNMGIVIPHYNKENQLIGIRERTLITEEEQYGKYKPAILNGVMYNHPLGFNLYNLNHSYKQIQQIQKAIVFESEKSTLLYASYFGIENDISVACCGSNLTQYQFSLLTKLGIQELIIAFDRQFQEIGDTEWKQWTKKLYVLHDKYSKYVQISYIFDTSNILKYKAAPIDQGKDLFLQLFSQRIFI